MTQIGELERKKLTTQISTLRLAFQAIAKACIAMNKVAKSDQMDRFMKKLVVSLQNMDELLDILEEKPPVETEDEYISKDTKVPFLKLIERKHDK